MSKEFEVICEQSQDIQALEKKTKEPAPAVDEKERQAIRKEIQDYSRRSHYFGGTGE